MTTDTTKSLRQPGPGRLLIGVLKYFFKAMIGAYALSVIGQLLLRFLVGEQLTMVAFFNTFAHLLWMPALILLPICLIFRQWRLSAMLIPAVAAFLITYGPQFIPREPPTLAQGEPVRLLTYNVLAQQTEFELTEAIINDIDADIVAMQEISMAGRDTFPDMFADVYPYRAFYATYFTTQGMGLMSRYPILEETFWQSDFVPSPLGFMRVVIDGPDGPLTIYNAHPSHPGMGGSFFDPRYRGLEIADLLDRARDEDGPVILIGDFNMPDLSSDYAAITAEYTDAYRTVGWGMGWTFPDAAGGFPGVLNVVPLPRRMVPVFPFLRLDYVFYRGSIQATQAEVWRTSGQSDHHPLWVDVRY